jgi:hypothetical protein
MRGLRPRPLMSNPWSEVYKPGAADEAKAVTKISISESRREVPWLSFKCSFPNQNLHEDSNLEHTRGEKKYGGFSQFSIFCAYYRFGKRTLLGYLLNLISVDLVYWMRRLLNVRSGNGSHHCISGATCVSAYSEARTENLRQCMYTCTAATGPRSKTQASNWLTRSRPKYNYDISLLI